MTAAAIPPPFHCDVQPDRDRVIVRLSGDFDLFAAPAVVDTITELLDVGFTRIVVDLRRLSFIDSTGLQSLLTMRARAHERGATFALVHGPHAVERIFEITETTSLFAFEDPRSVR